MYLNQAPNHSLTTHTTDYYITQLKQMTCTIAQITITQTVTTTDSQKITYIYFQNAQEHKKSGHTSNQY